MPKLTNRQDTQEQFLRLALPKPTHDVAVRPITFSKLGQNIGV